MEQVSELLALLRAAQESHHHAHWITKGASFAGDHLLFADLYTALDEEIDGLGEKAVQKYGPAAVDLCEQLEQMYRCVETWKAEKDLFKRALLVEQTIQIGIKSYLDELQKKNDLSIGMDNFLRQIADSHETALYKLGQRVSA